MTPITLSQEEMQLVKLLLNLYSTYDDRGPCEYGCECNVCKAFYQAGDLDYRTFDSLTDKVTSMGKSNE